MNQEKIYEEKEEKEEFKFYREKVLVDFPHIPRSFSSKSSQLAASLKFVVNLQWYDKQLPSSTSIITQICSRDSFTLGKFIFSSSSDRVVCEKRKKIFRGRRKVSCEVNFSLVGRRCLALIKIDGDRQQCE